MTDKRTFSYEEAADLLPTVQKLTEAAVREVQSVLGAVELEPGAQLPDELLQHYQRVVAAWAAAVEELGVDVKGVWLVDFDAGGGYYCWRYPEVSLQFFHGYEEGFGGRVPLT